MKLPTFRLTTSSVINVIGTIVILYLVVVLTETLKRNYDLGRQIDSLKGQMTLLQDQKDQLSYDIQYYKTDSFRDREARSKLGLQAPGENVIIIPHPSASDQPTAAPTTITPTGPKSNLQQWLDFLWGRV